MDDLGKVIRINKTHFVVYSMNEDRYSEGTKYHIAYTPVSKKFTCNCPAFLFRNENLEPCKHIKQVARWLVKLKKGGR